MDLKKLKQNKNVFKGFYPEFHTMGFSMILRLYIDRISSESM